MTLAADLLLLAIDPQRRRVRATEKLDYALMGAELVDLAISQRVVMAGDRVEVVDARPTGDDRLDAALMSLAGSKRAPRAKTWVQTVRKGMRADYLAALAEAGAIRAEQRPFLGVLHRTDYVVLDTGRRSGIKARMDAVAHGGKADSTADRAMAGFVHACGLANVLYPGAANRALRKRLEAAAKPGRDTGGTARATRPAADATIDGGWAWTVLPTPRPPTRSARRPLTRSAPQSPPLRTRPSTPRCTRPSTPRTTRATPATTAARSADTTAEAAAARVLESGSEPGDAWSPAPGGPAAGGRGPWTGRAVRAR